MTRGRFLAWFVASLVISAAVAARPASADEKDDARGAKRRGVLDALTKEQFNAADANKDGVLRGDEIPKGWLDRFDRDGDDDISRTEFTEVNARPPKLRRLHALRDPKARAAQMRSFFDRDKNGAISREEYPGRDDVFRGADRNRSGALEPAEVLALAADELEGIRKQMRNPSRSEFLSLFDTDRDNNVDGDEYDGPTAAFRKYDTDADGTVTYDELYPERMMAAKESDRKPEPEKATVIQSLDKDEDGKVSRAEFPGNDTAWRRLDTNGDGWITAADGR